MIASVPVGANNGNGVFMSQFEREVKLLGRRTGTAARVSKVRVFTMWVTTIGNGFTLGSNSESRIIDTVGTTRSNTFSTT